MLSKDFPDFASLDPGALFPNGRVPTFAKGLCRPWAFVRTGDIHLDSATPFSLPILLENITVVVNSLKPWYRRLAGSESCFSRCIMSVKDFGPNARGLTSNSSARICSTIWDFRRRRLARGELHDSWTARWARVGEEVHQFVLVQFPTILTAYGTPV